MEDVHRLHCSPELPVLWSFRGVVILSYCKFLSRQHLNVVKYMSAIRYSFLLTLVTVHKSSKAKYTYIGVNCIALRMLICMLFWLKKRCKYSCGLAWLFMYVILLHRLCLVCHMIYIPLNVFDEYLSQRHCNFINQSFCPPPLLNRICGIINPRFLLICCKSKTPCF